MTDPGRRGPRGRRGRRPGETDTRGAILAAARRLFAATGYTGTTVRAVAADAGVDAALIGHYFGSKKGLFAASIDIAVDPDEVLRPVLAAPDHHLGEALLRAVLGVWDGPAGIGVTAALRSAVASGDASGIREFALSAVLPDLAARIERDHGGADRRIPLVVSQLAGILLGRHVLEVPGLADAAAEDLVAAIGPTLTRYLTGPLDSPDPGEM